MPNFFPTGNGKSIFAAISAMETTASCFRVIHVLNLMRHARCCEGDEQVNLVGRWRRTFPHFGWRCEAPVARPQVDAFDFLSTFFSTLFSTLAQVSFSATVRLNTGCPGLESGSTQKYPRRSN